MIGQSVVRKEDARLLTGRGLYVADVRLPGMLHVAFVRSEQAHAAVRVNPAPARVLPGVVAAWTADDCPALAAELPGILEPGTLNNPYCDLNVHVPRMLMPRKASYVGEQIAVVVAETAAAALDGVEAVEVDYSPLPVLMRWEDAIKPGAPQLHAGHDNVVAHLEHAIGDVDAAFRTAEITTELELELPSLKSMALECRGSVASWDATTGTLNVWSTSQQYYAVRDIICGILGLEHDAVRVMARDVGGGFGLKGLLHPEDFIVPVLAHALQRPVCWIETRSEHMLASNQSGIRTHVVRVAAKRDGTILALDVKLYQDVGAFNGFEMVCPTNTVNHLPTHYRIPSIRAEGWSIVTNKTPVTPYRGAGRPEATFTMDRVLDRIAQLTGLDPLTVRERNIIPKSAMPYRTGLTYRDGVAVTYDGGDFPGMLESAVARADYRGWRAKQKDLRARGRLIGLGISSYVEGGGIGPSEGARVRIDEDGKVRVSVGVNSQGQGHETTLAQICAEHLGARFEDVEVKGGDTTLFPIGFGTAASRVLVNAGNAVFKSAVEVKRKVGVLAATMLECAAEDIELRDGQAIVKGTDRAVSFAALAAKAHRSPVMAALGGPGLAAQEFFFPRTVTWSSGVHVVVVEVDRETGEVAILTYATAHDVGVPLNPMIVDGQIMGGIAQGIGAALGETMVWDASGQILSGSLMDYPVLRAHDMPALDNDHFVSPTPENPLGVRAVGESGTISPPAVLAAAVEDAIGNGVAITRVPLTPLVVRGLLVQAGLA
ncbi:MAG: xanthine dehydrogenase family protein [Alphaproteobacteria bacterium]|nr:xanthine dehydrogenase family protein [Alphaproteobacteria bacterium]